MAFLARRGAWGWVDLFVSLSFLSHILLSLHVAFAVSCDLRTRLILDGREILRYYLEKASSITDALSVVPLVTQIMTLANPDNRSIELVAKYVRYSRFVRLIAIAMKLFEAANR